MKPITFEAIGTVWRIDIYETLSDERSDELKQVVLARIEEFDSIYSRFRSDSLVTKIAKKAGRYRFPDDAKQLFDMYQQLYDATDGRVTLLIGDLMVEAGYDAKYTLRPQQHLHAAPAWEDICVYTHPWLTVKQPVTLDFGAAGKGYLIDIIGALLEECDVSSYMIDAGGDMVRKGNGSVEIGLEHPVNQDEVIGVIELTSGSLCASSGSRRRWAGLHHIMNPITAKPVETIIATWVMADTALVADGLASALFFVDPEILREHFSFEYCLLYQDYRPRASRNFTAQLFTDDK